MPLNRPSGSTAALCLVAVGLTTLASGVLVWMLAGWRGFLYVTEFAAVVTPGIPLGWALFGRRHPAGWVAGALLGYVLTALTFWGAARLGAQTTAPLVAAWALLTLVTARAHHVREPLVSLPPWSRGDTVALSVALLLVPGIIGPPFLKIGAVDAESHHHYRAYFTADFLWHVALTDELTNFKFPPANPYAADLTLNYYWTYFLIPAVLTPASEVDDPVPDDEFPDAEPLRGLDIETVLELNALCAGLLFVAMIFLFTWSIVPRAGPAATAVCLALVAASAEGTYALWDLHSAGRPLSEFRSLNVDAITLWEFQSLTIDGLPRSLWYTPQHAMSCALGLIALMVVGASQVSVGAAALAGMAIGGAVVVSPFLGGAFAVVYGLAVIVKMMRQRRPVLRALAPHAVAGLLALLAVGWCVMNKMLLGAGGALRLGFDGYARNRPFLTMALALGPLLLPSLLGLWPLRRLLPLQAVPAIIALVVGTGLFYFVSIGGSDPVWVGWRAGQILLVTMPALAAAFFAEASRAKGWLRTAGIALALAVVAIGLPTTLLDAYNAQDISNRADGPGFPWTVRIAPAQHQALAWIRAHTPADAVVQMEPTVRGRATWTLIPTFARRRMAAGLPISLVAMPYYATRSQRVREMFGTREPARAWSIAKELGIDFVYLDRVEREAYGEDAIQKFDRGEEFFRPVFQRDDVIVYAVSD